MGEAVISGRPDATGTGGPRRPSLPPHVLFGAAYYPEYEPQPRLGADLDLMADAGFSVIRVGESVWSTWEPADGVFDLEWLAPVLDAAAERSIAVVLGTPTYAIPAWLASRHPEVMARRAGGVAIPYGHRQNADHSHPAFRFHAERVVRRVVGRYASHPAVIGFQVDNEPGAEILHNHGVFEGFRAWLQQEYGSVQELNRRWCLTYWSHRLGDLSDLWRPEGNTTQGYDLAWRRYQAVLTTDFIRWQADLVRGLARPDQFVTTCLAYGRPGIDDDAVAATLDVVAANPYYAMQDALTRPRPTGPLQGLAPAWKPQSGSWLISYEADLRRGTAGRPFLVTETNAGSIGESWSNHPAYDGQWRQAAWTLVARGARMVEYWHWHTLHHGAETYWGGVLGHSLTPGRAYAELSRIGAELSAAGDAVTDLTPDVDVAFLRSTESRWALQFQPALAVPGSPEPDPDTYERVFSAFYRGFTEAGLQAAVAVPDDVLADPAGLAAAFPVLVAPVLYVASDALLEALAAYVDAGGHLVATFRTGYVDADATARPVVAPGPLRAAAGVSYLEYTNLSIDLPLLGARAGAGGGTAVAAGEGGLDLPVGARATAWADGLVTEGASVLASYDHPHVGRWPAITTHRSGRGRLTWVGTLPDDATIRALAAWTVPEPANAVWVRGLSPAVAVSGAVRRDGSHLWFVTNWSGSPVTVTSPVALVDLLTGVSVPTGATVELAAWDIRLLTADTAGAT